MEGGLVENQKQPQNLKISYDFEIKVGRTPKNVKIILKPGFGQKMTKHDDNIAFEYTNKNQNNLLNPKQEIKTILTNEEIKTILTKIFNNYKNKIKTNTTIFINKINLYNINDLNQIDITFNRDGTEWTVTLGFGTYYLTDD